MIAMIFKFKNPSMKTKTNLFNFEKSKKEFHQKYLIIHIQ